MSKVFDVAQYILSKTGRIQTWKLQKLIYYAQAWSLAWDNKPLFDDPIYAWAGGPCCETLYKYHRRLWYIFKIRGVKTNNLTKEEKDTIGAIVKYYNKFGLQELTDIVCREPPFIKARGNLCPVVRGNSEISHTLMLNHYKGFVDK